MNRVDRLVSEETELGREKEHIRNALHVNGYLDWMLADSCASNESDSVQEGGVGRRGVEWSRAESASHHYGIRSSTSTSGHEEVHSSIGVHMYIRGISEQLKMVFRSFDIPVYCKPTNTLWQLLVHPKDNVETGKVVWRSSSPYLMWWLWCGGDWKITQTSFLGTPEKM